MKTAEEILKKNCLKQQWDKTILTDGFTIEVTIPSMEEYANQFKDIGWISIDGKKEIEGGKYLVIDPNWIEFDKRRTAFYRNYNGMWICDGGDSVHPSHYMKLPNEPTNE